MRDIARLLARAVRHCPPDTLPAGSSTLATVTAHEPAPPSDKPSSAAEHSLTTDVLVLLGALVRADRALLWAHAETPRIALAVDFHGNALPRNDAIGVPAPAWPAKPTFDAMAHTLLLPCSDDTGRIVGLAQVIGLRTRGALPAATLATFGRVLARALVEDGLLERASPGAPVPA